MTKTEIRKAVFVALDKARDGEEFSRGGLYRGMTAEHVADDLAGFNDDFEMVAPHYIQPHVSEWMSQQNWLSDPQSAA